AKKRVPKAHLYQMDARNSPFEESFDAVGVFDVLEHIVEDELVLKDIYKTLKPGGGILITVPRYMRLWSRCDDFVRHVRRYEPGELEIKLTKAGFQMVRSTCFVSFLLPLLVASRIWQHISPRPYDLDSELRVQGLIGGALETILNAERLCIGKGFNPSIGGSLLAIAIKPH
ncbi:MAG: class I SAM-dependent methyltransferase, partial [Candidatus Saccharimonadales bacterium]